MDGFVFLIWMALVCAVGVFASNKGRNPWGWSIAAFIFSPLLAGVVLALTSDNKAKEDLQKVAMEQQQLKDRVASNEIAVNANFKNMENQINLVGASVDNVRGMIGGPNGGGMHRCPHCGGLVKNGAIKCKFCGETIENIPMVECPYCKELIRGDASICKYCHSAIEPVCKAIEAPKATVYCSACGQPSEPGAVFCKHCGTQL